MDSEEQQEVLSGWKDIARYMGKGVRTVQRYERNLGLPVRRPAGKPRGSVVAAKSDLDLWVRSSATAQESFNRKTLNIEAYLIAEVQNGLRERAELHAEMMRLRKDLRTSVEKVHASILRLRQQLNETRRRHDSMSKVIREYSMAARHSFPAGGKHPKPN